MKNRLVSLLRSLKARSRFVVKFFLASSRLAVNRRGTGPSRLSLSNKFVVRGHSAKSTVATASLYYENIKIYLRKIFKYYLSPLHFESSRLNFTKRKKNFFF